MQSAQRSAIGNRMLDHRAFLADHDRIIALLQTRGVEPSLLQRVTATVESRRGDLQAVEKLRQQMNEAARAMQLKAKAGDVAAIESSRTTLKGLKAEIRAAEETLTSVEEQLQTLLLSIPNIPQETVPRGSSENDNIELRRVGDRPEFSFAPLAHWDIGESLGILDFERAAKMSGARFVIYRGAGARLERALSNFMLDRARQHGFEETSPPLLVRPEAMQCAGQYPKFLGDSFETLDREYVLIPTSEVALVNVHADEILAEDTLPRRYSAFTPCFRREAGAAGRDTRGLIRQHQFNKVELVSLTTPEASDAELERLTGVAESVLRDLGLHYRVMALCAGDMGFTAARTYDLEVWLPGQSAYREISSCSNCEDFQARRAQIRYRPNSADGKKKAKPRLLHTLNGSSLALGRTVVAILENYQCADGSVEIPPVLVPYFGAESIAGPESQTGERIT